MMGSTSDLRNTQGHDDRLSGSQRDVDTAGDAGLLGREIDIDLRLTERDKTRAEMHSIVNIASVIYAELAQISMHVEDGGVNECMEKIYAFGQMLGDRTEALRLLANVKTCEREILSQVERVVQGNKLSFEKDELVKSLNNLKSIFTILSVRAAELIDRVELEGNWKVHDVEKLAENMGDVIKAIETNSKGRYHCVYNIAQQTERDYLIDLKIDSVDKDVIVMPPVLQDVLRDLVANARKYTEPGGRISAGLADDGHSVHIVVEDTGCGIPDDEIEDVVLWGVRGSNVRERPTNGEGVGLTKAYMACKEFGGRFWIKSALEKGTRITLLIPRP